MSSRTNVLVTGAGGFIGHHMIRYLVDRGDWVRGVDIREPEYEPTAAHGFHLLDRRSAENGLRATWALTRFTAWPSTWGDRLHRVAQGGDRP